MDILRIRFKLQFAGVGPPDLSDFIDPISIPVTFVPSGKPRELARRSATSIEHASEEYAPTTNTEHHLFAESFIAGSYLSGTEKSGSNLLHLIGNDETPGSNHAQNKQFRAVVKILQLNKDQARELHDEISRQNHSFNEILRIGQEMFGE
ncbi:MAG: hypothetical protein JOY71_19695 [Acetobacteraceae bacterium]|nr:hypothetical protein [Acetobacteraceae bacterium]